MRLASAYVFALTALALVGTFLLLLARIEVPEFVQAIDYITVGAAAGVATPIRKDV